MKQFDLEEKQCIAKIHQIGNSTNGVLTNVFEDVLFNKGVAINLDNGYLLYDLEKYSDVNNILDIQRFIIKRALLIKYLEEHNYIYIINDSSAPISIIGDSFTTPLIQKLPTDITDILRRTTYRIYADSSLRAFIGQSFKTTDEITIEEAQKQTKYAKRTLVATVISLIITFILSIITSCTSPSKKQANELIQEVKYAQPLISNIGECVGRQLNILIKDNSDIVLQHDTIIQTERQQIKMLNQIDKNMKKLCANQDLK